MTSPPPLAGEAPAPREAHWDRAYRERRDEETSWYEPRPATSLRLIEGAALPAGARVLDVGGGTSRLVDHLLAAGYRPGVLDVSGEALARARARLGADAGRVEWCRADVTRFRSPHRWDAWHDRAALHFLTDAEDRNAYRDVLLAALEPGGYAVIATFGPAGPTRCSGLDVRRYGARELGEFLGRDAFEPEETVLEDHRTPAGTTQQFLFCRFRRRP